jgi:pimeloyl-ACP methyl ester carboxylesterase
MPYAEAHGFRLYYEVEGQGPPLILGHGGGDSLEMWRKCGYTDALKDDFQLILFDLPGHGRSDGIDPSGDVPSGEGQQQSTRRNRTQDGVVAILDSLEIYRAHYLGYSAGASLGFSLAIHQAERFRSFVLGGMTPYAWPETMVKAVNISIDLYRLLLAEPQQYLFRMEKMLGRPLTPEDKDHYLNQDAEGRIAGLSALIEGPVLSDEELAGITTPCMVFCGELDPFYAGAREAANHMPRARFLALPGLNHISALVRIDLVIPNVKEFLAQVGE